MRFTLSQLALVLALPVSALAQCDEIFISEYLEGWGNNKAIELFNPTDASVDLSDYRLERYSNGSTSAQENQKVDLSGTLDAQSVIVLVLDKQDPDGVDFEAPVWDELAEAADLWLCPVYEENNAMYFNGNDALVLRKISTNTPIDIFGVIGEDPGETGWADMTQNHTLIRQQNVTGGDTEALDDFLVIDEWDGILWSSDSLNYTLDSVFVNLGSHTCECGTTDVVEASDLEQIELYPNPASSGNVWVRSHQALREIRVFSLTGQRVSQQLVIGENPVQLSLQHIPEGIYLVEATLANGTRITQRVVLK